MYSTECKIGVMICMVIAIVALGILKDEATYIVSNMWIIFNMYVFGVKND